MKYKFKILLIFICLSIKLVFAAGAFDSIVQSYAGVTSTWQIQLLPATKWIFWTLSGLEFSYQMAMKKLLPNEISKLWVWLVVRFIVTVLFAEILLDSNFYIAIVSFFTKLGTKVGGASIDPSASGAQMYSPSALFQQEWNFFWPSLSVLIIVGGAGNYINSSLGNFFFNMAGAIMICMLILVVVVMLTLIESYFVLFAGFVLTGFVGSSWTINFWQKYLSYVGGVAIRLFCTSMLLGMFSTQWKNPTWLQPLSKNPSDYLSNAAAVVQNLVAMLGVFLFDMVVMVTLPSKAAAMLNGAVNAGFGEAIGAASMALSGGKILGGVTGGGGQAINSALRGELNAPAAARSAAFRAMRSAAKNNIGNDGGGGDEKWKQMLRTTGKDAANKAATDSMKGGYAAAKESLGSGVKTASNAAKNFSQKSSGVGSGTAGGSTLNMDPHSHR